MKLPARAFTHAGKFHADDVFSAALLRTIRPDIQIQRGFAVPDDFDGLVFDIGDGMFDHHAAGSPVRPNGHPYAAFGLLWQVLGPDLVGKSGADWLDERFVQNLDLNDCTGSDNALADAIGSFNPVWDSTESADECFFRAVDFAQQILTNRLEEVRAVQRARELVQQALPKAQQGILVLPKYLPWKTLLPADSNILFVVYPSQRGGFAAQGVNDRATKKLKVPFPSAWAGQPAEELPSLSGIEDLRFCHSSAFLITADSKSGALKACREAIRLAQESKQAGAEVK